MLLQCLKARLYLRLGLLNHTSDESQKLLVVRVTFYNIKSTPSSVFSNLSIQDIAETTNINLII